MTDLQKTLQQPTTLAGIGLHTGKMVNMVIKPAPENVGIVFCRTDVNQAESIIPANFKNVSQTMLGTVISNKHGVEVSTIEHLMAALWGCGVDNAIIEIDNVEVPIMDGSSEPFIRVIDAAGLKTQNSPRRIIRIKEEIRVGNKKRSAKLIPDDVFSVKFDIDFQDKAIRRQKTKFEFVNGTFRHEIATARTFCMKKDVEAMRAAGLALGGSLENAIVVDNGTILNSEGLRYEDEFVRHKILDSIGDLFLIGGRIQGGFIGHKSGHSTNNEILRTLMDNPHAWELVGPEVEQTDFSSYVFA